jgi:hypothetical protein
MPAGRPTDYTVELAAEICGRLAMGESMRTVCKDECMPAASTVFLWLAKHEGFSEQYVIAKEQSAEAIADEMFDIADDGSNDWMLAHFKDGSEGWKLNGEHVQRSRLRVDIRKWYLSKIKPKKYGEKISQELSGPGGGPIETKSAVVDAKALSDVADKL